MSMMDRRNDNLIIVHWHDTGRWLGVYGHHGVSSPCLGDPRLGSMAAIARTASGQAWRAASWASCTREVRPSLV
jgi:hypothetical protein